MNLSFLRSLELSAQARAELQRVRSEFSLTIQEEACFNELGCGEFSAFGLRCPRS